MMSNSWQSIRIARLFLTALSFSLVLLNAPLNRASASDFIALFPLEHLKGINTVVVSRDFAPHRRDDRIFPERPYSKTNEERPDPVTETVKKVFSKQKMLTVYARRELADKRQIYKATVIYFEFVQTARKEMVDGKMVALGSLGLQLWKYDPVKEIKYAVPLFPVSYPFLVPATADELDKILIKGTRFLTSYLPDYFALATKRHVRVDNDPTNSSIVTPFQDE